MKATKTVVHLPKETIEDLVRRCYCVRWIDGNEKSERIKLATQAVRKANPAWNNRERKVTLPRIPKIPYLEALIEKIEFKEGTIVVPPEVHRVWEKVRANRKLTQLSFVDPIRLGCEELGIAVTPEVAVQIHERFRDQFSFNQELYTSIQSGDKGLHGITTIHWVHAEKPGSGGNV